MTTATIKFISQMLGMAVWAFSYNMFETTRRAFGKCPHSIVLTDICWDKKRTYVQTWDPAIFLAYMFCIVNVFLLVPANGSVAIQTAYDRPVVFVSWLAHKVTHVFWSESMPQVGDASFFFVCIVLFIIAVMWVLDKKHGARKAIEAITSAMLIWFIHSFFTRLICFACARVALAAAMERNEAMDMLIHDIENLEKYDLKTFQSRFRKSKVDRYNTLFSRNAVTVCALLCTFGAFYVVKDLLLVCGLSWGHHFWHFFTVIYIGQRLLFPTVFHDFTRDVAMLEARAFVTPNHAVWTDSRLDKLEKMLEPERAPSVKMLTSFAVSILLPVASKYFYPSFKKLLSSN